MLALVLRLLVLLEMISRATWHARVSTAEGRVEEEDHMHAYLGEKI